MRLYRKQNDLTWSAHISLFAPLFVVFSAVFSISRIARIRRKMMVYNNNLPSGLKLACWQFKLAFHVVPFLVIISCWYMRKLHVDGGERCGDATSNQALKKYKRCKVPWIHKYCSIGIFVYINNRGCYKIKTKKLIAFWEQLHYLNQWMLQSCILEPAAGELNPNPNLQSAFSGISISKFFSEQAGSQTL